MVCLHATFGIALTHYESHGLYGKQRKRIPWICFENVMVHFMVKC